MHVLKKIDKNLLMLVAGLILGLGVGFLVLAGMQMGVSGGNELNAGKTVRTAPIIGAPAPGFELKGMDGASVSLSDVLGQPVLINFWASWCDPCRAEMPLIEKAHQAHLSDLVILAINDDEPEDVVRGFIRDNRLTFKILLDPGEKAMSTYRVTGIPTSFFIDREGVIRAIQVGVLAEGDIANHLSQIGVKK